MSALDGVQAFEAIKSALRERIPADTIQAGTEEEVARVVRLAALAVYENLHQHGPIQDIDRRLIASTELPVPRPPGAGGLWHELIDRYQVELVWRNRVREEWRGDGT